MLTKEDLEKLHGGPIGFDTVILGAVPCPGREVVYIADNGRQSWAKQFDAVMSYSCQPRAQHGGMGSAGVGLTLPDGSIFFAIDYNGDLLGWREEIEEIAAGLSLILAQIDGDKFVVSDGRVFPLSDCVVRLPEAS